MDDAENYQTLWDSSSFTRIDEPPIHVELLDSSSARTKNLEIGNDNNELLDDRTIETGTKNIAIDIDHNELLDECSAAETGNFNMETDDDNKELLGDRSGETGNDKSFGPDFQLNSEESSSSKSSEDISVLQNNEINADDLQDKSSKRKRSIKYEINKTSENEE